MNFIRENGASFQQAKRSIDADYARGYVIYLTAASETKCDTTGVIIKHPKLQLRVFDSKEALTYWTTDLAREILPLKEFKWDDTLAQANAIGEAEHA